MCTTKNRSVSKVNADVYAYSMHSKVVFFMILGKSFPSVLLKKKLQVSYVTMQNNMSDSTQKVQMLYWKMFKSSLKQKSMLHQIYVTC